MSGSTIILLGFNEDADEIWPSDSQGGLEDLATPTGLTTPVVAAALTGNGRAFVDGSGFEADDVDDAALLQRDITVQVLLEWDLDGQNTAGAPGMVIGAGKAWQLFLEVTNPAIRAGRVKLWWEDATTTHAESAGGFDFVAPESGYIMITATRRWISATSVRERYYMNGELMAEVSSSLGDIGGAAAEAVTVGCRDDGGGGYEYHLVGTIDGIKVTDYEMTFEEVVQTWRRVAVLQNLGYEVIRASVPTGRAYPTDPDAGISQELAVEGDALGEVLSKLAELRENYSPETAWSMLEDWERITGLPAKLVDTVETRRSRVLSFLRKVQGFSTDAVKDALTEAFDLAASDVEILEYSNLHEDAFASAVADWWTQYDDTGAVAIVSGAVRLTLDAAADGRWFTDPVMLYHGIDGDVRDADPSLGADVSVKVSAINSQNGTHMGLVAFNGTEMLFFGIYTESATPKLVWRLYQGGELAAVQVLAVSPSYPIYIRMRFDGGTDWTLFYNNTGPDDTSNETAITGIAVPLNVGLAHFQDAASNPFATTVDLDDYRAWFPNGLRVFNWYAYRDPALSGTPDMPGGRAVVAKLKPAHTEASAVAIDVIECDDAASLCDDGPLG